MSEITVVASQVEQQIAEWRSVAQAAHEEILRGVNFGPAWTRFAGDYGSPASVLALLDAFDAVREHVAALRAAGPSTATLAGRNDGSDLAASPSDPYEQHAEVVTVDGHPALVHSDQPLEAAGRAAIEIVIRAAREKLADDRPTDEDLQRWAERITRMPMSSARSWAGRLLNELVMERQRNAARNGDAK
ncbi:hypothetical protein [Nocardia vaccinii]|uniref:hypothetical protein n=1 Tax=Nocardia vaccinii TaxID=1822 RepID=UPI000832383B|nr:hypothetical protein [Nocardia vaccinii]